MPRTTEQVLDALNGGTAIGSVASRLLATGLNVQSLRTNDTLRKEEWLLYDKAVVDVARSRLVGVADLLTRGLRFDLTNAFGTTFVQWEKMSDMSGANVDMSGLTEGERDRLDFTLIGIPVPITHKDFQINIRALEASRKGGMLLDTTQSGVATRRVTDALESMLFNGVSVVGGGGVIQGYRNFAARNTGATAVDWNTATGANVISDVLAMIGALKNDNMYGPYMVYCSVAGYINLLNNFGAATDISILTRLKQIPDIIDIKPSEHLPNAEVLMIQMTPDVVDMVVGFEPMPIMWDSHGGMMVNVKVLAIMVPRLKNDYDGRCGIAHYV